MEPLVIDKTSSLTINVVMPKLHRYRCPKGHEWESAYPSKMQFSVGDYGNEHHIEGMVCVLCIGEEIRRRFPVEDMGEIGEPLP